MAEARIDKWMWASRIFKTRTIAAEACKKGRVSINGSQVKPARTVKPGDVKDRRSMDEFITPEYLPDDDDFDFDFDFEEE